MFPLSGTRFKTSALEAIASAVPDEPRRVTSSIPAGYTYFGQFVGHDISHMRRSDNIPEAGPADVASLIQETSPSLDLDSLYGDGLFDKTVRFDADGKFYSESLCPKSRLIYDLPREIGANGRMAFIADARNDENFLNAQMQVLFMNLHNKMMDFYHSPRMDIDTRFNLARQTLVLLYQQVVVNGFLGQLMDLNIHKGLFSSGTDCGSILNSVPGEEARIPIEFSGAAFRFGHSMVRNSYTVGDPGTQDLRRLSLKDLFKLTGPGGLTTSVLKPGEREDLLPYAIDWHRFFEYNTPEGMRINRASPIEPKLGSGLRDLMNELMGNTDLLKRNLLRGKELDLPCAQDIIEYIRKHHPHYNISKLNLRSHWLFDVLQKTGTDEKTPLWLYILIEPYFNTLSADKLNRLGPLGSIIVGETFNMLVNCSHTSIYHFENSATTEAFFKSAFPDVERDGKGIPLVSFPDLLAYINF